MDGKKIEDLIHDRYVLAEKLRNYLPYCSKNDMTNHERDLVEWVDQILSEQNKVVAELEKPAIDELCLQEIYSLREKLKIAVSAVKSYDPEFDYREFTHRLNSVDFDQLMEELNGEGEKPANEAARDEAVNDFRMDELDAVMTSVDKWLEGDALKNNPATRAADAREIALQAIEKESARADRAEKALKEASAADTKPTAVESMFIDAVRHADESGNGEFCLSDEKAAEMLAKYRESAISEALKEVWGKLYEMRGEPDNLNVIIMHEYASIMGGKA